MFHCTVKVNIAYEPNKKKLVRYFKQIMALTTIDWQLEFNAQKQWWKKWTNFVKFSLVSISPESVHIHKDTLVIATIMIILFIKKWQNGVRLDDHYQMIIATQAVNLYSGNLVYHVSDQYTGGRSYHPH